ASTRIFFISLRFRLDPTGWKAMGRLCARLGPKGENPAKRLSLSGAPYCDRSIIPPIAFPVAGEEHAAAVLSRCRVSGYARARPGPCTPQPARGAEGGGHKARTKTHPAAKKHAPHRRSDRLPDIEHGGIERDRR